MLSAIWHLRVAASRRMRVVKSHTIVVEISRECATNEDLMDLSIKYLERRQCCGNFSETFFPRRSKIFQDFERKHKFHLLSKVSLIIVEIFRRKISLLEQVKRKEPCLLQIDARREILMKIVSFLLFCVD